MTLGPVPDTSGSQATPPGKDQAAVNPEDDFQREMTLYVGLQMQEMLGSFVLENLGEGRQLCGCPWDCWH